MTQSKRRNLSLDFDGVIHRYDSEWDGHESIPDPPVDGAFDFITQAIEHYDIAIFSVRSKTIAGIFAMREWFLRHGLPKDVLERLSFPSEKPRAVLYIDDRGWQFNGTFPSLDEIKSFKPWNRR